MKKMNKLRKRKIKFRGSTKYIMVRAKEPEKKKTVKDKNR